MKKLLFILALFAVVAVSQRAFQRVYKISPAEGLELQQSYLRYSKAQAIADTEYQKYEAIRQRVAKRANESMIWCGRPDEKFLTIIQDPGCGE